MKKVIVGASAAYATYIIALSIAWYRFNLNVRDQTQVTANCYNWFQYFLSRKYAMAMDKENITDYSEGNFGTDFDMTLSDATIKKYDNIFKALELKEGMTLLDAGCGNGRWLEYCRSKGVNGIGMTLSSEQAKVLAGKGLEVYVADYRILKNEFIGKFDRITALGSTEHVCTSRGSMAGDAARERSVETLTQVWQLFNRYLKPEGKCFYTFLTVNEDAKWTPWDYFQSWVLDQHYGGYYPRKADVRDRVIPNTGFEMENEEDHTRDYHWASMRDPNHFGYFTIDWSENTLEKVMHTLHGLIHNPAQVPFHWLYQICDTWMWQFGGPQNTPLTDEQVRKAPMQLMYFEAKKIRELPAPDVLSIEENPAIKGAVNALT